jgi:cytochrome c peroxidase
MLRFCHRFLSDSRGWSLGLISLVCSTGISSGQDETSSLGDFQTTSGAGVRFVQYEEDLEDGGFTEEVSDQGRHLFYAYKNSELGPWTVEYGSVEVYVGTGDSPLKNANVLDLNGKSGGTISQTVQTEKGKLYQVSFFAKPNFATSKYLARAIRVRAGRAVKNFSFPAIWPQDQGEAVWQSLSLVFRAVSHNTTFEFTGLNRDLPHGVFISGIELDEYEEYGSHPASLSSLEVPLPDDLDDFVVDREKAIVLGKALFWDMQVGSDNRTACATCHWAAGADHRVRNMVYIGAHGTPFDNPTHEMEVKHELAEEHFRGANSLLTPDDFPFRRHEDPWRPGDEPEAGVRAFNPLTFDTVEIGASQGVILSDFLGFEENGTVEIQSIVEDEEYNFGGANARIPTERNAPTMINAVFFDRLFWDGRAQHFFNGVNNWGELDQDARVLKASVNGGPMEEVQILLNNAALASQAVGPVLSEVEMSWMGRSFPDVARKLFALQPLGLQRVAEDDGVLGPYVSEDDGIGLDPESAGYAKLIREAFAPEWWSSEDVTEDGFTQMEANFSLFWGLSVMLYESTLVSDQSPYDQFANGDQNALSEEAQRGLQIFMTEGNCIDCHEGAEFAGATVDHVRSSAIETELVDHMEMEQGSAFYDDGFYNIGVRAWIEDIGLGAEHPEFGHLSYSRREQTGDNPDPVHDVAEDDRVAVDGAFKAPSLRNVELTGPYMHNGGFASLEQVIQFYARGADFFHTNIDHLDPVVHGAPTLQDNPETVSALIAFLESLTDERVRHNAAPFDHPELVLPHGHLTPEDGLPVDDLVILPATGREGGSEVQSFEETLESFPLQQYTGESIAVEEASDGETEPAPEPKEVPEMLKKLAEKHAAAKDLKSISYKEQGKPYYPGPLWNGYKK